MKIPHVRDLHKGMTGVDVVVYRTALVNAGFMPRPKTKVGRNSRYMGPIMAHAAGKLQKKAKLPVTNTIGPAVHTYLVKHKCFTSAGVAQLKKLERKRFIEHVMIYGVHYARACVNAYSWVYSGPHSRTIGLRCEGIRKRLRKPISGQHEDCSSGACAIIGAAVNFNPAWADPNGNKWAPWGSTMSMQGHGRRVPYKKGRPLTCHFYGHGNTTTHVVIQLDEGYDENWSFGQEPAPALRRLFYRSGYLFSIDYLPED